MNSPWLTLAVSYGPRIASRGCGHHPGLGDAIEVVNPVVQGPKDPPKSVRSICPKEPGMISGPVAASLARKTIAAKAPFRTYRSGPRRKHSAAWPRQAVARPGSR